MVQHVDDLVHSSCKAGQVLPSKMHASAKELVQLLTMLCDRNTLALERILQYHRVSQPHLGSRCQLFHLPDTGYVLQLGNLRAQSSQAWNLFF